LQGRARTRLGGARLNDSHTAHSMSATGSPLTRDNNSSGAELGIRRIF
jgi:hypothetical protein